MREKSNCAFITSYERDNETDLDYAKARMFGSNLGRYTSPDPAISSARTDNPQTLNRYIYVLNNPLNFVDPFGLWEITYETAEWDNSEAGKVKVKRTQVFFKKTDKNDNAETLLEGLGISAKTKDGKDNPQYAAMKSAIESVLSNGGDTVLSSQIGDKGLSKMFSSMESLLTEQANYEAFDKKLGSKQAGPFNSQFNDCSMTTFRLFGGVQIGQFQSSDDPGFDTGDADDAINTGVAVSIDPSNLRSGDFARMENSEGKLHFMTLAFTNSNGTRMFFSRSGVSGEFAIRPENDPFFASYGAIKGVSKGHTGYYGRKR